MSINDKSLLSHLRLFEKLQWQPLQRSNRCRYSPPEEDLPIQDSADDHSILSMLNKAGPHWSSFLGQPTLADALNGLNLDNLPEHAALLGACEDGLPFLIDLANPVPGAILIAGDTRSGKTALIRSILASVQEMDSPEQVIFTIFTAQPDEYRLFNASANCQIILPFESKAIAGQIASLKEAAEKRKHLGPEDPCLILAIDDISTLLSFLDETGFASLYWLIRHGPR